MVQYLITCTNMPVGSDMNDKTKLIKKIDEKQRQLYKAEQEMSAWNNGKYKSSTNATASTILVKTLRDEADKLNKQLKSLGE